MMNSFFRASLFFLALSVGPVASAQWYKQPPKVGGVVGQAGGAISQAAKPAQQTLSAEAQRLQQQADQRRRLLQQQAAAANQKALAARRAAAQKAAAAARLKDLEKAAAQKAAQTQALAARKAAVATKNLQPPQLNPSLGKIAPPAKALAPLGKNLSRVGNDAVRGGQQITKRIGRAVPQVNQGVTVRPQNLAGNVAQQSQQLVGKATAPVKQMQPPAAQIQQLGGNLASTLKQGSGVVSVEVKKVGVDIVREGKTLGGDFAREGKQIGGDIAREGKNLAGDIAREGKSVGGDIAREGKKVGGDIAREGRKGIADIVREGMILGGDVAREGKQAGGDIARESKVAGGWLSDRADEVFFLNRKPRERRSIGLPTPSQEQRQEALSADGYTSEQQQIIEQLLYSEGGLQGEYAQALDVAFGSAFEKELERWWHEKGVNGDELTDAELDRMCDQAMAGAETQFLSQYGLGTDGQLAAALALDSTDDFPPGYFPPETITAKNPAPEPGQQEYDFPPAVITPDRDPVAEDPIPVNRPTDNGDSGPTYTKQDYKEAARQDLKKRFKSEFKEKVANQLATMKKELKKSVRETVGEMQKFAKDFRKNSKQWVLDKAPGFVVDQLSKIPGGATEATGFVVSLVTETQKRTSAKTLSRDKTSKLVMDLSQGLVDTKNPSHFFDGMSSTRNAALDRVAKEGKTVYRDANGNWYQNDDPKFVPKSPFTELYRPVAKQADGGTIKQELGTATDRDRVVVSDVEVLGEVSKEYFTDYVSGKVQDYLKDKLGKGIPSKG